MPIRTVPPIIATLHRFLLAAALAVAPVMAAPQTDPVPRAQAVPGEFLVRFKPSAEAQARTAPFNAIRRSGSTSVASLRGLESRFRLKDMKEVQEDPYEAVTRRLRSLTAPSAFGSLGPKADRLRKRLESLQARAMRGKRGRVYKLAFDPRSASDGSLLAELKKNPDIESVQPNYLYYIDATVPNDPKFNLQRSHNTVHATQAWDITQGSDNVVVAVIDLGVDWAHEDLATNIWNNADEIAGDGIDNDGNGYVDDIRGWDFVDVEQSKVSPGEDFGPPDNDPMDFHSHGTHVSGIIAARGNNLVGIAGINWRTKIMALRAGYAVPGSGSLTSEAVAGALSYAALNGADVVNMSFGAIGTNPIEAEAVMFAQAAGCLLVGGAGNDHSPLKFSPGGVNGVITVAATNVDHVTWFSNWGANVDISAPGYDILSTIPGNAYVSYSGTSMASPLVAGGAITGASMESSETGDTQSTDSGGRNAPASPPAFDVRVSQDFSVPGHDLEVMDPCRRHHDAIHRIRVKGFGKGISFFENLQCHGQALPTIRLQGFPKPGFPMVGQLQPPTLRASKLAAARRGNEHFGVRIRKQVFRHARQPIGNPGAPDDGACVEQVAHE